MLHLSLENTPLDAYKKHFSFAAKVFAWILGVLASALTIYLAYLTITGDGQAGTGAQVEPPHPVSEPIPVQTRNEPASPIRTDSKKSRSELIEHQADPVLENRANESNQESIKTRENVIESIPNNCPFDFVTLRFVEGGNVSSHFHAVKSGMSVPVESCQVIDEQTRFRTNLRVGKGAIPGSGRVSSDALRMSFGYTSDFAGGESVECILSAKIENINSASLSCNTRKHNYTIPDGVKVEF